MLKRIGVALCLAIGLSFVFPPTGMVQPDRTRFFVYYPMYLKSGIFVFPVEYSVPRTLTPAKEALAALVAGPPSGSFLPVLIPRETKLRSVTIKDGLLTVDFSAEIRNMSVGSGGEAAVLSAIVNTAAQFPTVRAVRILVEGQPADSLAGHIDISGPLEPDRAAFFQSWSNRFPDVPHWAEGHICLLKAMDIVSGCGDGTFAPDRYLTRSELIALMVESAELPYVPLDEMTDLPFSDVPPSAWYSEAVRRAVRAGLITAGDYGSHLRPEELVTREEMAWMLVRAQDIYARSHPEVIPEEKIPPFPFADEAEISPRYLESVKKAQERGLIVGTPDGRFMPRKVLTRAEAAVAAARMLGIMGTDVLVVYPQGEIKWDGGDVTLLGAASSFEGNVLIRARDSAGNVIFTDYTTSTNGMGWGAFGFKVAADRLQGKDPAAIEVYLVSAKDGSEYAVRRLGIKKIER